MRTCALCAASVPYRPQKGYQTPPRFTLASSRDGARWCAARRVVGAGCSARRRALRCAARREAHLLRCCAALLAARGWRGWRATRRSAAAAVRCVTHHGEVAAAAWRRRYVSVSAFGSGGAYGCAAPSVRRRCSSLRRMRYLHSWRARGVVLPRRGRGSAAVQPPRRRKNIAHAAFSQLSAWRFAAAAAPGVPLLPHACCGVARRVASPPREGLPPRPPAPEASPRPRC
jgi:hypothetical protein